MRDQLLPQMRVVEAELKELKKEFRDPEKQPPTNRRAIWLRKQKATLIYTAIAHSRGRVHKHNGTLEDQQKYLDTELPKLLEATAA